MISEKSGIYKITNLLNEKFYVGSAINFKKRWFHHRKLLRKNKHFNCHLQFAWNKYGEQNFNFIQIEECDKFSLMEREQFYLDKWFKLNQLYNLNPTAYSQLGRKHSKETKEKLSKANKGRVFTESHKEALSEAWHKSQKSKLQNEMARKLARLACIGRIESAETRAKKSAAKKGIKTGPMLESVKKKLSMSKRIKHQERINSLFVGSLF